MLISADLGCHHWRPGRSAKAADSAARRLARRKTPPPPVDQEKRTASNREYQRAARERAKTEVAEFARIMGRTYR